MVIALAQIRPVVGDVKGNIPRHEEFIREAFKNNARLVVFPELSLTGYEPRLANSLARELEDHAFNIFQELSDYHLITIAIGLPLRAATGVEISLVIFQPRVARRSYSKHYLHADEKPYFMAGPNTPLTVDGVRIALAICFELSVDEHIRTSFATKPDLYVASVAKTKNGTASALAQLARSAKQYSTITMMCNSIGFQDGGECWGTSAAWNKKGEFIGLLDPDREGILFVNLGKEESNHLYFS